MLYTFSWYKWFHVLNLLKQRGCDPDNVHKNKAFSFIQLPFAFIELYTQNMNIKGLPCTFRVYYNKIVQAKQSLIYLLTALSRCRISLSSAFKYLMLDSIVLHSKMQFSHWYYYLVIVFIIEIFPEHILSCSYSAHASLRYA